MQKAEKSTVRQYLATFEFEDLNRAALRWTADVGQSSNNFTGEVSLLIPFSLLFRPTVESMQSPKGYKGVNKVLIHS